MEDAQLDFVGLHWLLAAPPGLHVTTPDIGIREQSWTYIRGLIDLCSDLAGSDHALTRATKKGVMVFGSPKQRSAVDGMMPQDAAKVFAQELARVAPYAELRGVTILVEALPANQSDVINSLAEAVAIVQQINSPAVQTMFDTHNAVDEKEEHASLIRKYREFIHHVHVNELDGREPGTGKYDFRPVLQALAEIRYPGWISLEVFDFTRGAEEVAERARRHLEAASLQKL
jgi:sugar phosphate isomerase/epimerase